MFRLRLFVVLLSIGCPTGFYDTGTGAEGKAGTGDGSTGGGDGGGSGPSDCPTTAACGCSEDNKDECGGPCCKWTVGEGCGCK
jgi:hypothetical protein